MAKRALTPKQQRFVDEYFTNGRNASAAYRAAYNAERMNRDTIGHRAFELLRHGQIAAIVADADARAAQRLEASAERYVVTKEWISTKLAELAAGKGILPNEFIPAGVRSQSLERLARLHGLVIDRKDMRMVRSFADLSDEEIAALVAEGDRDALRH